MFKKDRILGIQIKSYQLTLFSNVKIYDIIIHLPGVITKEQITRFFNPSLILMVRAFINEQQFKLVWYTL